MIMPTLQTKYFGYLEYQQESVYYFAAGIPGFEKEKQFLFVDQPVTKPLIFMQSLEQPELCFLGLPIRSVDPGYRLHIGEEDLLNLDLSPDRQPEIGADVLCLALVSLSENHPPTANLLAPIVVNLKTRRATQAIQVDTDYSHQHRLCSGIEAAPCS